MTLEQILAGLDEHQYEAVTSDANWTRVYAGAGTGKTRTIIHRIARDIALGTPDHQITALTFTKKAANEMKHRIQGLLGSHNVRVATFHSLCARILRRHWETAGFISKKFLVADEDDCADLMFNAYMEINKDKDVRDIIPYPDEKDYKNKTAYQAAVNAFEEMLGFKAEGELTKEETKRITTIVNKIIRDYVKFAHRVIGAWKENGLTVEEAYRLPMEGRMHNIRDLYRAFEEQLTNANMIDFSGLILKTVSLFKSSPAILEIEAGDIKHLLVDEFQDTNRLQLELVMALTSEHLHLTVVGDPDQSIYAFRNTDYRIITEMIKGKPEHITVKDVYLVTNRRCTDQILRPAVFLVDSNPRQEPKVLKSGMDGALPTAQEFVNEYSEATSIVNNIEKLIKAGTLPSQIAVLYRSSSPMTILEQVCIKKRIKYMMVGGSRFAERAEIKDVLSYVKLAIDPNNELAFNRIFAKPLRGMGAAMLEKVLAYAKANRLAYWEALIDLADGKIVKVKETVAKEARLFGEHLRELMTRYEEGHNPQELIDYIYKKIGYFDWCLEGLEDNKYKVTNGNLHHLLNMSASTNDIVELVNDIVLSETTDDSDEDSIFIMTMHASKGLEFDYVFIPCLEETFMPSPMSSKPEENVAFDKTNYLFGGSYEEERRLFHVAITRARKGVFMSYAKSRQTMGMKKSKISPFLKELIVEKLVKSSENKSKADVEHNRISYINQRKKVEMEDRVEDYIGGGNGGRRLFKRG